MRIADRQGRSGIFTNVAEQACSQQCSRYLRKSVYVRFAVAEIHEHSQRGFPLQAAPLCVCGVYIRLLGTATSILNLLLASFT